MNTFRPGERPVTDTSPASDAAVSEDGPTGAPPFVPFGDPAAAFCADDHCEIPGR